MSKHACRIADHDFTGRDVAHYHGTRTDDCGAAYLYPRQHNGSRADECVLLNAYFACQVRSGANVNAIANDAIVIYGGGRIHDNGATESHAGANSRHRQDLSPLAHRGIGCNESMGMNDSQWLHTLLLKPFLDGQAITSPATANRNAGSNRVCFGVA